MMNKIYKHLLAASLLMMGGTAMAQTLNSAYFTDDYKFRHDMNPAFENKQNYITIPALGNMNVNLQGNFGYQDIVLNNPMYGQEAGAKKMTSFMNPYISADEALKGFSKNNNRIQGDVGISILSAGFKGFGGYNTIELNAKASFGASLPYELFEFAKNTGNQNYEIGDVSMMARSYAELALGHSHQINKKLRIGAKLKFLFGVADGDVRLENLRADLSGTDKWIVSGKANAQVSMKGFTYKTSKDEYNNPEKGEYEKIDDVDVDGAGLGGFGMALDLGGVYKLNDNLTLSASVLDLGFINWSNNMKAVNRAESFEFNGFHDTAVRENSGPTIDDKIDDYGDQITDFINLKDLGDQGSRTTALAATLNFAVSSFATSMGYVLNIHPKGYNFFIGMDHILGKTSKEFIPLSSNASIALGMSVTW